MTKKEYKAVLIAMSGVRVYNQKLMQLGLTLPGFVDRSKVIAGLPSLGLLTIAAQAPPNWQMVYREFDEVTEEGVCQIINESPDLVAFSSLTARIHETYALASRFRKANIKVVIGGLHVSALPGEAVPYADSVVQGEGELVWPELLDDFEQGRLKPLYSSLQHRSYAYHFQSDAVPRYDLLHIEQYNRLTLQTTRGCPLHCTFCAASRTISSYKKKPVTQVEKELNAIFEVWKRPFIELADDNSFVDKKWSKELLRMFARYPMKWFTETDISIAEDEELLELLAGSNCAQVLVGLETSHAAGLKGLDRANWKWKQFDGYMKSIEKIQSYGISVNGCFILGFDSDTKESFSHTEAFIRDSRLSEVQITLLTPFPGTDLYRQLAAEQRLLKEKFWDQCTLFDVTFQPKNFTVEELEHSFQELMSRVYAPTSVDQRRSHFRQTIKSKWSKTHV